MSFRRLFTAFTGFVNDTTEEAADKVAIVELRQESREAKEELKKSDQALSKMLGRSKQATQKVVDLKAEIQKRENQVRALSAEGKKEIAMKAVTEVQSLRANLTEAEAVAAEYEKNVSIMRTSTQTSKDRIRKLDEEINLIESREQMQKAQAATLSAVSGSNSKTKSALDSLDRIKSKQAERGFELSAAEQLADDANVDSLDKEIDAALNSSSADDELARILANG